MEKECIAEVRRFNRTFTQRIGALRADYLGSGRPLGEARLLFEIGLEGATIRELRTRLSLDSGYLSRLLRELEAQELTSSRREAEDGRVRRVRLTTKGVCAWQALDRQSDELAASILAPLTPAQRERLLSAMREVAHLLRASAVTIAPADPCSGEARACFQAYFDELQARFDGGFDPGLSVSANPEELVPPHGCLLIARVDGSAVGCAALKVKEEGYGEIKRMWVSADARRLGVARRLLVSLEERALEAGLGVLQLDTHRDLSEARALYARNGYVEIAPYNTNPYAHHWFEKRLVPRGKDAHRD